MLDASLTDSISFPAIPQLRCPVIYSKWMRRHFLRSSLVFSSRSTSVSPQYWSVICWICKVTSELVNVWKTHVLTFSVKVIQWRLQMEPPKALEGLRVLDATTMGVLSILDCANKPRREGKASLSFSHSPLCWLLHQRYRLVADACPTLCRHHYHQMRQSPHTHIIIIIITDKYHWHYNAIAPSVHW